jgi:NAD(P)-dependent dehydrogenase (short-subunit alcohol dehydrogenase family)
MTTLIELKGKTAIITGASSGLGEQFARCLSNSGARVILAARRIDKLEALSKELENSRAIQMDVSDKQSVKSCFAELEKDGEKIDICVNNAGIAKWTPIFLDELENYDAFGKGGIEVWDEIMAVNLRGTWLVTQYAATHMKKHKIAGSIINIASTLGECRPAPGSAAASVSKAGIIHLTRQLVPELSKYAIRINCIIPGMFHTKLTQEQISKRGKEIEEKTPLKFIAEPSDLDGLILYLASNNASKYVTGSCITIDGGMSCVSAVALAKAEGGKSW